MDLVIGADYKRTDLHDAFGGQRQGGISTPRDEPMILLFTGESGEQYGYSHDGWQGDGIYWYTGEGQVGHMEMVRGNKAIANADAMGKTIHLFAIVRKGYVRYTGPCTCVGHHSAMSLDRNGNERRAIVFELAMENPATEDGVQIGIIALEKAAANAWSVSMAALRAAALARSSKEATPTERRRIVRARSAMVRTYVLRRAAGDCEACGEPAPFTAKDGRPYLEPHHIDRLADGGPDHPAHVAAVCPNCHKRIHFGRDGDNYNGLVRTRITNKESKYR